MNVRKSSFVREIFSLWFPDGILDAFPGNHGEDRLQEILLQETTENASEMAADILEEVLKLRCRKADDDMTKRLRLLGDARRGMKRADSATVTAKIQWRKSDGKGTGLYPKNRDA